MNNELISQQARCISHELRNHLSICEIYTDIIKKTSNDPKIKNAVSCIKKSLKVMNNVILDLQTLNNVNVVRCDLQKLIGESVGMAKVYKPKAEFVYDAAGEVCVDENKLCACLVNIIKNALEAGATRVEVFARPERILLSNNGTPVKNPQEIFKEGFTTKQSAGGRAGAGLGLYICKKNLEAQGADLRLVKSDKKSTEFEIIVQQNLTL